MKHLFIGVLYVLGISIVQACSSKEEDMALDFNEEKFVSQIEFATWPSSTRADGNPTIQPPKDGEGTSIIKVRIARKKKNCNSGFGLCDFKLFPKKKKDSASSDLAVTRVECNNEKYFEIQFDSVTNTYYVNMLLAKVAPNTDYNLPSLKIEEDLYWINDEETQKEIRDFMGEDIEKNIINNDLLSAKSYKIATGEIPFNGSLGLYGGYQIRLILVQ